jgi:uncharacterized protein (DUF1778 family)
MYATAYGFGRKAEASSSQEQENTMSTIWASRRPGPKTERRNITINMRTSNQWRALIDRAAAVSGKNRTEFILDSARRQAEDVLLDQRLFVLDDHGFNMIARILDDAPPPHEELKRLMQRKAPWAE